MDFSDEYKKKRAELDEAYQEVIEINKYALPSAKAIGVSMLSQYTNQEQREGVSFSLENNIPLLEKYMDYSFKIERAMRKYRQLDLECRKEIRSIVEQYKSNRDSLSVDKKNEYLDFLMDCVDPQIDELNAITKKVNEIVDAYNEIDEVVHKTALENGYQTVEVGGERFDLDLASDEMENFLQMFAASIATELVEAERNKESDAPFSFQNVDVMRVVNEKFEALSEEDQMRLIFAMIGISTQDFDIEKLKGMTSGNVDDDNNDDDDEPKQ